MLFTGAYANGKQKFEHTLDLRGENWDRATLEKPVERLPGRHSEKQTVLAEIRTAGELVFLKGFFSSRTHHWAKSSDSSVLNLISTTGLPRTETYLDYRIRCYRKGVEVRWISFSGPAGVQKIVWHARVHEPPQSSEQLIRRLQPRERDELFRLFRLSVSR